jgi:hypothetical protein
MAKLKTEFQLVWSNDEPVINVKASIIGQLPKTGKPYVSINPYSQGNPIFVHDKDLERFAVNILKAIKSKKLK